MRDTKFVRLRIAGYLHKCGICRMGAEYEIRRQRRKRAGVQSAHAAFACADHVDGMLAKLAERKVVRR